MDSFKRVEELRKKEAKAREELFQEHFEYSEKITNLEKEIDRLKEERASASYNKYNEIHTIRCLITEIYQGDLEARKAKYTNEQ